MLMKGEKRRHSLLVRVLSLYMLTFIPILLLQYYNYSWSADVVNDELVASARSNISYLRDSFEDSVDAIVSSEEYLITSAVVPRYLTYYATMKPAEKYVYYSEIIDRVANVRYSHPLIDQLALYYPTLDRWFWVNSNRASSNFPLHYSGEMKPEDEEALLELYRNRTSVLVYGDGAFHIIYGKQFNDSDPYLVLKARKT